VKNKKTNLNTPSSQQYIQIQATPTPEAAEILTNTAPTEEMIA